MARFMGGTQGTFGSTIVSGGPYADTADPTVNVLWLGQAGLGLPERDSYTNDSFKTQRDAFRAYTARTMKMAAHADPEQLDARRDGWGGRVFVLVESEVRRTHR